MSTGDQHQYLRCADIWTRKRETTKLEKAILGKHAMLLKMAGGNRITSCPAAAASCRPALGRSAQYKEQIKDLVCRGAVLTTHICGSHRTEAEIMAVIVK